MSVQSISYTLKRDYGNHIRKLIMISIADFSNDDGEAWPSIDTLANRSNCSRRSVQEHLTALEKAGDLAVHKNAGPCGTNLYRIIFKKITSSKPPRKGGANGAPPQQAHPCRSATPKPQGGGADQRRPFAPEPLGTVNNPSRERETAGAASNSPARSFTEDEFCDLIDHVNGCRPEWKGINFTSTERSTFLANLSALASITPEQWTIIPRYLSASHPEGRGAYLPKSRERLLRDITDVLTHALGWERKHRPPTPKPKPKPEESTEPSLSITEQLAILNLKP